MTPLPKPSVDTGMGLERLAAVMQGVHSNYEIDLFAGLIDAAAKVTGAGDREDKSLRVIADHIRSCAFLVLDGVVPSNEGRGYVLRRIARRAIRHGHRLGARETFFHRLVGALDQEMGDAYPGLRSQREVIERVLRQEEERFAETLDQGMRILDQAIGSLDGGVIDGETVFRLYDTYGFPVDLTADVARERGLSADLEGFEAAMEAQRSRARASSNFAAATVETLDTGVETEFTGYDELERDETVLALYRDGEPVEVLDAGEEGLVVLGNTPFYAESGGQVGDRGVLEADGVYFEVSDTRRQGGASVHIGAVTQGSLAVGASVRAAVDRGSRTATMRNHSATHLVHAALRKVLGDHVMQKGSLVAPDRLRFDFSHYEPVSAEQLRSIERMVNGWVLANDDVVTRLMPIDEAKASGAMALFGEKYDDVVRVLTIGPESTELCGGTHVHRVGDIGLVRVIGETGVAAGVRRIEAVTGDAALDWVDGREALVERLGALLKSDADGLEGRVGGLLGRTRELERELQKLRDQLASARGQDLMDLAVEVQGLKVLAARLDGADAKSLPGSLDQLKQRIGSGIIVLGAADGDKVALVAGVTDDLTARVQAGPLVNHVAGQVGGKGGGRPDMARAGGKDPGRLDEALGSVPEWVATQL